MLRRAGLGRALRALHYALIVLAAWAAAAVVLKVVRLDLDPKVAVTARSGDTAGKAAKPRRAPDEAVILRRNIFGAADLEVASEEAPAAGSADLRLRGVASSASGSFAVFENTSSGEQNVFAVGERIFEGPKLLSVDATGADVLQKGRKRRYEIEQDDAGPGVEKASLRRGKDRKDREKPDKGAKGAKKGATVGVRRTGDGNFLVDRREVESVVSNLNEVITQVRAVPVLEGGKSAGFKLFNIQRGSIFEKLGLNDGDIVQRVNDTELTDPSKAVGLLEEVQSMSQIRVNFVRGGKPRSHTYTIQ